MAAQRMPLGHKRRGEAELAYSPEHRSARRRFYHAQRARAAGAETGPVARIGGAGLADVRTGRQANNFAQRDERVRGFNS